MSGKRTRCASTAAYWSTLPDVLLDLILSNLNSSLKDCLSLAATCRDWRSVAKRSETSITTNWLTPTTHHNNRPATAFPFFHDVVSSQQYHLYLPEIEGFTVFGSPFGWLIASRPRSEFLDPEIKLVNPISAISVPLPNPGDDLESPVVNAVLTATPDEPDCFALVEHAPGRLAFAKPGGGAWLSLQVDFYIHSFACSGSSLYCLVRGDEDSYSCVGYDLTGTDIGNNGSEFAVPAELLNHQMNSKMRLVRFPHIELGQMRYERLQKLLYTKYHLVEIKGRICLVVKFFKRGAYSFIEIFKLEVETKEWSRVESLGDSCLVIQDNLNLSVVDALDDPDLVPGCIYYPLTNAGCVYDPFMWWQLHIQPHMRAYISADSDANPISRLIYYPSTSIHDGTQIWATSLYCTRSWGFENGPPRSLELYDQSPDTYSNIYPSVLLRVNPPLASYLQRYDNLFLDEMITRAIKPSNPSVGM